MFTLTIKAESLEELESFIASLRYSAPTRLVAEVTAAADKAGVAEHQRQHAKGFAGTSQVKGEPMTTNYDEHDELVAQYTELFGKAPRSSMKDETIAERIAARKRASAGPAPAPEGGPTLDDAREALKTVTEKNGMEPAMDLLRKFGCVRISEVDSAKYGEFIEACNAAT